MSNLNQKQTETLRTILAWMNEGLVERYEAVKLALLAVLAGEHLLLLGDPGVAKSLTARKLSKVLKDPVYFERLLTRFTVVEELFGPLSIKALEEDRYHRQTEGYLPKANVAFLDEVFKANSAILNALLTILNEREFDNGTQRQSVPLAAVVGASNELPEPGELDALLDRFLLRLHVPPVSSNGFDALMAEKSDGGKALPEESKLTTKMLDWIRQGADQVEVPKGIVSMLRELREFCLANDIPASDRRWCKIKHLLQTAAFTNGRTEVSIWDCWLIQFCLGTTPEHRSQIYEWYEQRAGVQSDIDLGKVTRVVAAFEKQLSNDQTKRIQKMDRSGKLLFHGLDGKEVTQSKGQKFRDKEPLFLAPQGATNRNYHGRKVSEDNEGEGYTAQELRAMLTNQGRPFTEKDLQDHMAKQTSWFAQDLVPVVVQATLPKAYVAERKRDIAGHAKLIVDYRSELQRHMAECAEVIRGHLWVPDEFAEPAQANLKRLMATVENLLGRLESVSQAYDKMPIEEPVAADAD